MARARSAEPPPLGARESPADRKMRSNDNCARREGKEPVVFLFDAESKQTLENEMTLTDLLDEPRWSNEGKPSGRATEEKKRKRRQMVVKPGGKGPENRKSHIDCKMGKRKGADLQQI